MKQGVTVSVACALTVASMSLAAQSPFRVGGGIRPPVKIQDVKPVYPDDALKARVQGVEILEITVQADGSVADPTVLRSIPLLDQAAIDCVRQWKYEPVQLNGTAVAVRMTVTVNFLLPGASTNGPDARVVTGISGGVSRGLPGVVSSPPTRMPVPRTGRMPLRMGRPDGTVDVYELSDQRVVGLPAWDPQATPDPPLSVGAAIVAARIWIQQQNPRLERLESVAVRLERAFADVQRPNSYAWFYELRFQALNDRGRFGDMFNVMVLLDGSIVEPRNESRGR